MKGVKNQKLIQIYNIIIYVCLQKRSKKGLEIEHQTMIETNSFKELHDYRPIDKSLPSEAEIK